MKDITSYLPNLESRDTDWILYFEELDRKFKENEAKLLFNKTWLERGNKEANTYELRSFLEKKGINLKSESWMENITDQYKKESAKAEKYVIVILVVLVIIAVPIALGYLNKFTPKFD